MKVLNQDVVDCILERVPVKALGRFKSVSKQWKSTIESKSFQERQQSIHRQQSPDPDVLFMTFGDRDDFPIKDKSSASISFDDNDGNDHHIKVISSSPVTSVKVHIKRWVHYSNSCDGLVCICSEYDSIMINPTTRWHRTFPLSHMQLEHKFDVHASLGFGKDKFNGTYKSVWLSPMFDFGKKKTLITCEVFDFGNNAWRYVTTPASPYLHIKDPVLSEGSLHWLTFCESDIQVLSFDLHTETFQVIAAPFDRLPSRSYELCNLNNRLCLCETNHPKQVMWLLNSDSKTWNHMCSIDLEIALYWFRKSTHGIKWIEEIYANCIGHLRPVKVLEEKNEKNKKVLFYLYSYKEPNTYFVTYDCQTESFDFAFAFHLENHYGYPLCYFQSLISI